MRPARLLPGLGGLACLACLACLAAAPAAAQAQPRRPAPAPAAPEARGRVPALDAAAARAGAAWLRHDADSVVAGARRVLVELPGAAPAPALGRAQAAALLREYLGGAEEVELSPSAARELLPGRGYVELRRRYRVRGTQEVRSQTVLLGFRLVGGSGGAGRWELAELRVLD